MPISTPALDHIRAIFARWNEDSFPGDPENATRARAQADTFIRMSAELNRERNVAQAIAARRKPELRLVR